MEETQQQRRRPSLPSPDRVKYWKDLLELALLLLALPYLLKRLFSDPGGTSRAAGKARLA